ncbi:thioesterase family protein [Desulfurococcaceae archaeon MEX13E-LK6-19]|nr:thioesterase family protein [Desulfurococcaceae archaeon MEX13E-LK6-19]
MSSGLEPGIKHVITKIVREEDTAKHVGSGGVSVLSTPTMIAWMENAALQLAEKYLPENQTTVGIHVDIYHKAPAPIGAKVDIEAELVEVKGRRLVFKVKAYSGQIIIGEGIHERYIVDKDKFKEKIKEVLEKIEKATETT